MRCLLDTHVLIWIMENSPKLSENARKTIADRRNLKYVSIVSFWEIALKLEKGTLTIGGGLPAIERLSEGNENII